MTLLDPSSSSTSYFQCVNLPAVRFASFTRNDSFSRKRRASSFYSVLGGTESLTTTKSKASTVVPMNSASS